MALVNTKICSRVLGKMPPIGLKTLATYFGRVLVCLLCEGQCMDISLHSATAVGLEYFYDMYRVNKSLITLRPFQIIPFFFTTSSLFPSDLYFAHKECHLFLL